MNQLDFSLFTLGGSLLAGLLGSLTGLGGGVVIVPMLVLLFKVDIHYAIGASLVSVIATSSGAAAAYVREGYSNIRIGMFLEIATTLGAVGGAFLAPVPRPAPSRSSSASCCSSRRTCPASRVRTRRCMVAPDPLVRRLRMNGTYPGPDGHREYYASSMSRRDSAMMFGAGVLSGLLGIGSGALKVLAMDQAMRIPFKVSTTTSNFMIGVTAAASAGIYLRRGYIDPALAARHDWSADRFTHRRAIAGQNQREVAKARLLRRHLFPGAGDDL